MKNLLKKTVSIALAVVLAIPTMVSAESKFDSVGEQGSIPGTTRTIEEYDSEFLSVSGHAYADGNIHDRTEYYNTDYHRICETEEEFLKAIKDSRNGKVKIIEVVDDMDLGWLALSEEARNSGVVEPYKDSLVSAGIPHTSPSLMTSGISTVTIQDVEGLTIFSPNGSFLKHAEFKLQDSASDIVIRNLEFDEMYEWDDSQPGGVLGGNGYRKRTGWTYIKVNGANDVWIDHCSFGFAFDGNVDVERGSKGVTISWCKFGKLDYSKEGSLYKTICYLEDIYQNDREHSFKIYTVCRDAGMTPFQMMQLMAYHKKVHMLALEEDAAEPSQVSFMYNHYENCGSRIPLCGGANAEMINCYIDNRDFYTVLNTMRAINVGPAIKEVSGYYDFPLYALNVRQDGAVGADTCVFQNVESPVTDYNYFRYEYGQVSSPEEFLDDGELIVVNSEYAFTEYEQNIDPLTNSYKELETTLYRGGTYDNNGVNEFTRDETFVGSTYMDFKWIINDGILPFEYKVVPLEDVREVLNDYSGCGKIEMSSKDWLKTEYTADFKHGVVEYNAEAEKLTLNVESKDIERGKIFQLEAKIYPNNAADNSVTWKSSDESVAYVNDAGTVKGVSSGKAIITATSADGKLKTEAEITVQVAPEKITLSDKSKTIYMDDGIQLGYTINPEDADFTEVTWNSSNTSIVKVDENGKLTPVSAGKATITVSSTYDSNVFAKCTITVKEGNNPNPTAEPCKLGDANNDGIIDAKDALLVLKSAAKLVTMDGNRVKAADVNNDGNVDASDALQILKVAAKLMELEG